MNGRRGIVSNSPVAQIQQTGKFPTVGYPEVAFNGVSDIRAPKQQTTSGSVTQVAQSPTRLVTVIVFLSAIGIVAYVLHDKYAD
jgi:hypothetical protein